MKVELDRFKSCHASQMCLLQIPIQTTLHIVLVTKQQLYFHVQCIALWWPVKQILNVYEETNRHARPRSKDKSSVAFLFLLTFVPPLYETLAQFILFLTAIFFPCSARYVPPQNKLCINLEETCRARLSGELMGY